ncbi:MAG TPA: hypothetical protein VEP68_02685, partial [Anaeromyxobacteraceae bacterium]|nr:hypothetical protein [Anaeromyxobacteraceae bacterium]
QRYDPASHALSLVPGCDYYQGGDGASADGSRVAVVGSGVSPAQNAGFYLGSSSAFQASAVGVGANVVELDRSGSRIVALRDFFPNLLSNGVYDATWSPLGQLGQAAPNNTLLRVVLRRDGARAVAWDDGSTGRVRIYDLTASPVAGFFPEVGSGVAPIVLPGATGSRTTRLALSADGSTAFLAGDQAFVVVPLP